MNNVSKTHFFAFSWTTPIDSVTAGRARRSHVQIPGSNVIRRDPRAFKVLEEIVTSFSSAVVTWRVSVR